MSTRGVRRQRGVATRQGGKGKSPQQPTPLQRNPPCTPTSPIGCSSSSSTTRSWNPCAANLRSREARPMWPWRRGGWRGGRGTCFRATWTPGSSSFLSVQGRSSSRGSSSTSSSSPSKSFSWPGAPPPTPTNTEGVRFLLASTQAWMGAAETIRGQLDAAERLVRYQLQGTSPNMPFDNVLPHVGSALELHVRVQAHYTPSRVVAAATDQTFRMPVEPSSPPAGSQGGYNSRAAGSQGAGSHDQ